MIAGITGHRELGNLEWIKKNLQEIISKKDITYGFTCLAIGADEIFAELLRQNKIGYTAIIPCNNYETTFEEGALQHYLFSRKSALEVIELNNSRPTEKAFNEAGKSVVDNSEILIAGWDGKKAKGFGGTGDIVEYAKLKDKKIIQLNPIIQKKIFINYG